MRKLFLASVLFILLFTGNVSAQKVYKVQYESQAGWKNKSKEYLLKFKNQ